LEDAVRAGLDARGEGLLLPLSRAIANAPEGAATAARALRERINAVRDTVRAG
jgi:hypothetical protein